MEDTGEMIDLTGLNDGGTITDSGMVTDSGMTTDSGMMTDSGLMTDAELAEKLQMEELESLHQSDFEVARHLQEMEQQRASHFVPDLFMFGEAMRRSNYGYSGEDSMRVTRRCRPPRPPPPWPMHAPRTSNSDEHDAEPGELCTDNPRDDATSSNGHQGAASASSASCSRYSTARKAQNAMNRNRGDPAVPPDGTSTEPEHLQNAVNHRDPVPVTAFQNITAARAERLREAMNRNRRGQFACAVPPNFPVTDAEQPRPAFYQARRGRNRLAPPVLPMPSNDAAADVEESRDALNHNHLDPMAPFTPPTDADGDAEQQDRVAPPPVPPRRSQRRSHRNRRVHGPMANLGLLQYSMRPIADCAYNTPKDHETLEMPGWAPVRRHYEYSRMLDEDDGSGNNYDALWELSEQIGEAANKGLNLMQITRLPTMKYKAPSSTVTSDDMTSDDTVSGTSSSESMTDATLAAMETICRVCLCGFENDEVLRALPCCHRFHVDCIDQWIKQNAICPVCRDRIKDHFNGGGRGGDQWNQYE